MIKQKRATRKFSDEDLKKLNSVGLSLGTIAKALGCNPSAITHRLKLLGIKPTDTRKAFMEEIILSLTPEQQDWIVKKLQFTDIKSFIKQLIIEEFNKQKGKT